MECAGKWALWKMSELGWPGTDLVLPIVSCVKYNNN